MRAPLQLAIIFTVVAVCWLTGCKSHPVQIDTSSDEAVERDIRAHLPIGSSTAQVLAYLDDRKIDYSWPKYGVRLPGNSTAIDPDTGLPIPDAPTVDVFIPYAETNNSINIVIKKGTVIDFTFDATKSHLVKFTVRDVLE
ncbi:MAG TPA: hypothetical protein VK742_03985 [Candidatus Sulfotelmatobacter sp.]|jgi:hypothetical protein|nr:hypothetical protein [Candidatus Sulfotelmatobacter sp.]